MKKTKKRVQKVFSVILSLLLILLVVFVFNLVYASATNSIAYFGKNAFVQIVSPSMEPEIPTGEYILVEKYENQKIEVGDIILFRSSEGLIKGEFNTHRVVEINEENGETTYTTKGDNNTLNDNKTVKKSDINAVYVKNISLLSKIVSFFNQKAIFFLLIIVPALLLIYLCIKDVYKKAHEIKIDSLVQEEVERMKSLENKKPQENREKSERQEVEDDVSKS